MMRKRVAELVSTFPSLKNNSLYYLLQRARSFRGVAVRPELSARPDVVRDLERDGVASVTGLFTPSQIKAWVDSALAIKDRVLDGSYRGEVFYNDAPPSFFRIADADRVVPESAAFFEHPDLESIARAYISPRVRSYRRELDVRFHEGRSAQADLFHFDNWRPILKAFLLLTDVGVEQAPFRYLASSHRWHPWRYRHELAFDVDGNEGRFGHFLPQEIRKLRRERGWREILGTGTAGTVILADVRGLHAGTPLKSGHRAILTNTWDLMNSKRD